MRLSDDERQQAGGRRPSDVVGVDDPERPTKLDNLIRALGAEVLDYPESLDCCGGPLLLSHPETAVSIAATKLSAVQRLGVHGLVTLARRAT